MSRRASAKSHTGIELFPFLAVLICTMGALVVLLHAFARQGQVEGLKAAQAKAKLEAPDTTAEQEEVKWRIEQLKQARAKTEAQLADERLKLSHVEDHQRRLLENLRQLQSAAADLEQRDAGRADADRSAQLEALKTQINETRKIVDESRKLAGKKASKYSIIPYEGPHGTSRRPIYIECRASSIVLQPEGITLTPDDFLGYFGAGNPLAVALRAQREYLARQGGPLQAEIEPYPMLLVRPEGIEAYYVARSALTSWGSDFGYELVGSDWDLKFPDADPRLNELTRDVVAEARVRHREYVMTSVRVARSRSRPTYHARSRGGFVAERGSGGGGGGGPGGGWESLAGNWTGRGGQVGQGDGSGGAYDGVGTEQGDAPGGAFGDGTGNGTHGRNGLGGGSGLQPGGSGGELAQGGDSLLGTGSGNGGSRGGSGGMAGSPGGTSQQPGAGTPGNPGGAPGGTGGGTKGGQGTPGAQSRGQMAGGSHGGGSGGPGSEAGDGASSSAGFGSPSGGSAAGGDQSPQSISVGSPGSKHAPQGKSSKRTRSLAQTRGNNWGLPESNNGVPASRPILVECHPDRLVILPEDKRFPPQEIRLGEQTQASMDELVSGVWQQMKGWGIAGRNMYWQPTLVLDVKPGAADRYADIKSLLADSGLEVRERRAPATAKAPSGRTGAVRN